MSSYVKSTNFASKDSLAIGNPLKIVKGTEIDEEFNNIATAIDTKADLNSPTFIGTPIAPTAAPGTNTTQLATTAFVTAGLQALYPVGSIYINAGVTTNPATLLGFGTWTAFGAGRVMVGLNGADSLFDALEETGGSKDATLVSHNHSFSGTTSGVGDHQHIGNNTTEFGTGTLADTGYASNQGVNYNGKRWYTSAAGAHSHTYSGNTGGISANHTHGFTTSTNGSSATNANLPPYITVYMWKRTA
jgi:hypothetical protein